jgi:5-methylcytosine-specific restriction endonuclease McrA
VRDVLLLNADFSPIQVVGWQRAILLLLDRRAVLLRAYDGLAVRSVSLSYPWPAVVHLARYARSPQRIRFSRAHVLARDGWTCAYCGTRPRRADGRPDVARLTLDHVIPRSLAVAGTVSLPDGRSVPANAWENVVTACPPCNRHKRDRTPEEAGMRLLLSPRRPRPDDAIAIALARRPVPSEWQDWVRIAA